MIFLVGDVGGTNTRLMLAEYNGVILNVLFEKTYASLEFADFYSVLKLFLQESSVIQPISAACIGLAGPVDSTLASVTNLSWVIKAQNISDILNAAPVTLMNDFVAVSHGVAVLEDKDILTIQSSSQTANVSLHPSSVIIGAGTGLGVSCRTWVNGGYHIISSETGHTGFAPATELQTELLLWLQKTQSSISLESLLSGRGFETIYTFLRDVKNIPESRVIKESMQSANAAEIITNIALSLADELCEKTLNCFVQIYGAAAGNTALNYYPVDEVFIAGGIAPKIKDRINSTLFIDAFNQKGLMTSNMQKVGIKLITQDRVGLYGALSTLYKS